MSTFPGRYKQTCIHPQVGHQGQTKSDLVNRCAYGLAYRAGEDCRSTGDPRCHHKGSTHHGHQLQEAASWSYPFPDNFVFLCTQTSPQPLATGRRLEVVMSGIPSQGPVILLQGPSVNNGCLAITIGLRSSVLSLAMTSKPRQSTPKQQ